VSDAQSSTREANVQESLRGLLTRAPTPPAGNEGENLPWDAPAFSERMLREHLNDANSAASRRAEERDLIVDWLWERAELEPELHMLDLTCGPGLYSVAFADRGLNVTGIDFAPAAIEHARNLANLLRVDDRCSFVQADVRKANLGVASFDVALVLYGQITVFPPHETLGILQRLARAVGPGGILVLEVLDAASVSRSYSTSWYAAERGLWSDSPHLALTECYYDASAGAAVQRIHVLHEQSGALEVFAVVDYVYDEQAMVALLEEAGFGVVEVHRAWSGLALPDAERWVVYLARAGSP
jgi:ubiquinone/menaquinone biosynthesis C-methylase UbiE